MGSLKCIIPGVSLKVFGRAIQSLSKIGDELYLEPLEEGLFLKSVNSSRSAFACFQFSPNFFINYIDGSGYGDNDSEAGGFRCKLGMKSVMTVFRNLSTIEKTVEKCKISLLTKESKLVFQLYCRHGIIKTHNLSFMDCESLQAVFSKDLCPNKLTAQPKLLCDAVLNFQAHQEEITLILRPDFVALKNYVEDETNPSKVVHTELTLVPDEFDHFQVGVDTDVTYCLKEFRAVLAFADVTNLPLSLHFEKAGRPLTFSITSDLSFEANFVLATLANDEFQGEMESQSSHQGSKQTERRQTNKKSQNASGRQRTTKPAQPSSSVDPMSKEDDDEEDMELAMMNIQDVSMAYPSHSQHQKTTLNQLQNKHGTNVNDNSNKLSHHDFSHAKTNHQPNVHHLHRHNNNNHSNQTGRLSNLFSSQDSQDCDSAAAHVIDLDQGGGRDPSSPGQNSTSAPNPAGVKASAHGPADSQLNVGHDGLEYERNTQNSSNTHQAQPKRLLSLRAQPPSNANEDNIISPVIPFMGTKNDLSHLTNNPQSDDSEEDEEIPGTPPNKKFRALLFGTQSSTQSTTASQSRVVLAPDSDCDD